MTQEHDPHSHGEGGVAEVVISKPKTKKPRMYCVIMHNDDFTPMDFVIMILEETFRKPKQDAFRLMMQVHEEGQAVCGVYTYEVAEMKVMQVSDKAREKEYPLRCSLEPES